MSFVEEVADAETQHVHGPNCSHGHSHEHEDHEQVQNIHGAMVLNRNERGLQGTPQTWFKMPIPGIHRVTFVRGKMIFAIAQPEVYKNPTSDSYIVLGG